MLDSDRPKSSRLPRFRFRVQTILLLTLSVGLGLAWWRDRAQLSSRLEMRDRQVRQLQRQLDERSIGGAFFSNLRFKTPEELAEFLEVATEEEFLGEDWSMFAGSFVADQSIGKLVELTKSPRELTRKHAVQLLAWIGKHKRPPQPDPIPALIAAIDDPSLQTQAIIALGHYGSVAQAALPRLQEIMHSDQFDAFFATMAVKDIDPSENIGPRLRELFMSDSVFMRQNVASHLPDHLPTEDARRLLEAQYERETDDSVREVLAMALNKITD